MRDLIVPEYREMFDRYLARIKVTGADKGLMMVLPRTGEPRIWEYSNTLRTEGVSRPIVRGMAHDITERRRAEQAMRAAKEFSENLIQTANVMILGLDTDGTVNLFNDAGAEITGYTFAELKGKSWSALVPRDRFPLVWAEFDKLVQDTADQTFENPILTKTGDVRFISWRNNTVKVNGKVVATISFGNDITERKRAEEGLRRREEDYRTFVAQSTEGIFREELDALISINLPEEQLIHHILHDSYMAECNDAMARMYGFTSGQEMGGQAFDRLPRCG
jgi:PAS domain S-box-containing protein